LESQHSSYFILYCLSLENITSKQRLNIKSSVIDVNTCLNGLFPSFNTLNSEFSSGFRLIDKFHSQYSFHWVNHKNKESKKAHLHKLDDFFSNLIVDSNTTIVILYTSIKNNIATSIAHVYLHMELVKKTIYHAVNVTTTEAELFAIRCGIKQAILIPNISYIIVITDSIHSCQAQFTLEWKSAEWTQRWADLWNDLGFSLCAVLSVCHMVATSDDGKKVWVGVSTNWCVAIEHQRSSSIRVYLCQLSD